MITASELRTRARAALQNNWGIAIIVFLIVIIIMGIPGCNLLLAGPLALGLAFFYIGITRKYPIKFETMLNGFNYYIKSFVLSLLIAIFTILWMLLLIIPGIVKAYSYSMSYYIMADNPEIDANTAIKQSMYLMNGNKMRMFCLDLSFIGWIILSILTSGILFLWVGPYMSAAHVQFYEDLLLKNANVNQTNTNMNANQTNTNMNANQTNTNMNANQTNTNMNANQTNAINNTNQTKGN